MNHMNTATPLGFLFLMLETRLDRARDQERGASAVEWVVISAIVLGIVGLVAVILREALTGKADDISNEIGNS